MRPPAPRLARGGPAFAARSMLLLSITACGPVSPTGPPATLVTAPTSPAADVTRPPALVRLIALVGPADDLRLVRIVNGTPAPLALPRSRPAWVSGDSLRGLVLTDRDGTLRVAAAFGGGGVSGPQPTWTTLRLVLRGGVRLHHPLSFATLSADGSRIAAIADDPASGGGSGQLVVVETKTGMAAAIDLGEPTDGRPPAWLGPDEVVVPTRDSSDRTDLTVIHPTSGERSRWPIETSAIATATIGRVIAIQERTTGRVAVGSADEVANGGPASVVKDAGPGAFAAQMVLDGDGHRLAVAWLDDAGDTRILAVYERRADAWAVIGRDILPVATNRAVLAGFDP